MLVVAAVFLAIGFFRGHFGSVEALRAYIGSFGPFAPLMLTAIQTMQAFLPIIPSFFGFVAGAGLFGAFGGFLCNYIGISIGSIIAYCLAPPASVSDLSSRSYRRKNTMQPLNGQPPKKANTVVLFLSILLPLAPDCVLCYFSRTHQHANEEIRADYRDRQTMVHSAIQLIFQQHTLGGSLCLDFTTTQ